jgi:hypothetical protein
MPTSEAVLLSTKDALWAYNKAWGVSIVGMILALALSLSLKFFYRFYSKIRKILRKNILCKIILSSLLIRLEYYIKE